MKKHLLLSISLLASLWYSDAMAKQVRVTIGTGTTQSYYVPYGNYDKNATTQFIYTKEELGSVSGPITSIAFDVAAASSHTTDKVVIYIGNTDKASFSSKSDYVSVSGLTKVYEGNPKLGTQVGWEEIVPQTVFKYDGKSNLVFVIGRQAKSYSTSLKYNVSSATQMCLRRGNDNNSAYGDPTDTSIDFSTSSDRPNIQLIIGEEELTTINGITYKVFEGEAKIVGYTAALSGNVSIPSTIQSEGQTCSVVGMSEAVFKGCSTITSVSIGSNITSIPSSTFEDCTKLTTITIPNSITTLGDYVFKGCSSLETVSLGTGISILPLGAFQGCTGLSTFSVPSTVTEIKQDAFADCTGLKTLTFEDGETELVVGRRSVEEKTSSYYKGTFADCPIETLSLGRNLKYSATSYSESGYAAPFYGKVTLTSLSIGSKVTSLGQRMFSNCTGLKSLVIPANVTTMNPFAFWYCIGLEEVIIEDSEATLSMSNGSTYYGMFVHTTIKKVYLGRELEYSIASSGGAPFYNVQSLETLTIGSKVKHINDNLFTSCTGIKEITLPATLESIGEKTFYNCTNLQVVQNLSHHFTITAGSEDNGYVAYYALHAMNGDTFGREGDFLYYSDGNVNCIYAYIGTATEVTVPAGYQLDARVFQGMTSIEKVNLPNGLLSISDYCFDGCTSLTSVNIPSTVKSIGTHAFYRCDKLTQLPFTDGALERIEDFAFGYCREIVDVHLPAKVNYIGRGAFYENEKLETINIPNGVTRLGSFAFKNCEKLQSISIPATVDSVEMHTFYDCASLTKAELPSNLKRIGESAFQYCSKLTEFSIPSTVTYIGQLALSGCSSIPSIEIPAGLEYVGMGAFRSCSSITSISIPAGITDLPTSLFNGCSKLTHVQLPENINSIGTASFAGCRIQKINWPSSLRSIGYMAFSGSYNMSTVPVIPANVTNFGIHIYANRDSYQNIFCYSDIIMPDDLFFTRDIYQSTLYVKPSMLEAYRQSVWARRFGDIKPMGDINCDGKLDISDITLMINNINETELPPFSNIRQSYADLNGDFDIDVQDVQQLQERIGTDESFAPFVPLDAEPVEALDVPTPSENCASMYNFYSYDLNTEIAFNLINQLRFEACIEGIIKPSYWGEKVPLTEADFVPVQWSTDLERVARTRATEARFVEEHVRLNGKGIGTVESNGVSAGSENLGWGYYGSIFGGLGGYYSEKHDYLYKTGKTTGHYTNLIDPTHRYIGIASIGLSTATEMWSSDISALEHDFLPGSGLQRVFLDVQTNYIDSYTPGTLKTRSKSRTVHPGEYEDLYIYAYITASEGNHEYLIVPNGCTFVSSDPEIASIDENNRITFKKLGEVTVTSYLNGEDKGSIVYTVTCVHDYYYDPVVNYKTTGRCTKCGDEQEYSLPTYLWIYWNNSESGVSSYGSLYKKNPVGSYVMPWIYDTGGSYPYNTVLVTNDRPDLLETTGLDRWLVKGVGEAHVTFTCKYNPSITRTYTINCTEEGDGPSRAASRPDVEFEMMPESSVKAIATPEVITTATVQNVEEKVQTTNAIF